MDAMECLGMMVRVVPWDVQDERERAVSLANQENLVRQAGMGVTEMTVFLACGGRLAKMDQQGQLVRMGVQDRQGQRVFEGSLEFTADKE